MKKLAFLILFAVALNIATAHSRYERILVPREENVAEVADGKLPATKDEVGDADAEIIAEDEQVKEDEVEKPVKDEKVQNDQLKLPEKDEKVPIDDAKEPEEKITEPVEKPAEKKPDVKDKMALQKQIIANSLIKIANEEKKIASLLIQSGSGGKTKDAPKTSVRLQRLRDFMQKTGRLPMWFTKYGRFGKKPEGSNGTIRKDDKNSKSDRKPIRPFRPRMGYVRFGGYRNRPISLSRLILKKDFSNE
jgi:hypothetical protein